MATLYNKYIINIYERYLDLKNSNKQVFDNYDLSKIFEYYSCLKLTDEYKKQFYEYDDIDPTFKEDNQMSRNDTGIDCSDLDKTIVQCKLRKTSLTWTECSTFFASQNLFNNELNKATVRWNNLIITRNSDSTLSDNLLVRRRLFIDKPYDRQEMVQFCENLVANPPAYPIVTNDFTLRDYQIESINMIKQNKKNVIVNLPTGTGKNSVIIYSFEDNKKYLILVPRIILMDQLQDEIIKHKPLFKNKIQLIGDSNNTFDSNKNITICVFNSVSLIESHCSTFEKIYVDEAHHINKPEIYCYDDEPIYEVNEEVKEEVKEESEESDESEYDESDEAEEETDEDLKDDSEDELRNVKTYNQIIKSLIHHNNNVYLSATIDKIDEFEYYSKDIRQMIERGFLCDYTIHIPIFSEDPDNRKICDHLLRNYRNIIIYCNSQKEGKEINRLMNELQNNSCMYIDCNTSKKNRDIIINKYKKNELQFLVNVRILVEGFDAPITKGVCFLHLPKNKTTLIQIIGRALRLHATKTIANIILPFSSKEDEKNICNFLKVMAQNDSRIRKSFESKKIGGYISIEKVEEDIEDINDEIEFKYNMIYDSMGRLTNGDEIWMKRLEEVKNYIDEYKIRPSQSKKSKVKTLGKWVSHQIQNYKNKIASMSDPVKYQLWTEFMNNEMYRCAFKNLDEKWNQKFEESKLYIEKHNQRPPQQSKLNEVKLLECWFSNQKNNYKNKINSMKDPIKYQLWTEFINNDKYKCAFIDHDEVWNHNFEESKLYIEKHNQRPSNGSKISEVKSLGIWFSVQMTNYKNKINSMKDPIKYQLWTEFINNDKYKCAFIDHDEVWNHNFEELKLYIEKHNQRPSQYSEIKEVKFLGCWLGTQKINYKNKINSMKDPVKYQLWTEFMNDDIYKCAFRDFDDEWNNNLEESKLYIEKYNARPSSQSKIKEVKSLGLWILRQVNNYKLKKEIMKKSEIYDKWTEFITSEKYKIYFISNEEAWNNNLEESKLYINQYKNKPSPQSKIKEVKSLSLWIFNQVNNYKLKKDGMKNPYKQHLWYNFITNPKYSRYFDQDISLPDPLPDAEQSNNPLDEYHPIERRDIVSKKDIEDERNNISAITSILNRYENKMNIDNSSIQERLDGRPKRRNKANRQEMFQE